MPSSASWPPVETVTFPFSLQALTCGESHLLALSTSLLPFTHQFHPPAKSDIHPHHSTDCAFIKFPLPSFQVQRTSLRLYPVLLMRLTLPSWNFFSPWLLRHQTFLSFFWFVRPLYLILLCSLLFPADPLTLVFLVVDLSPSSHPIWPILLPPVLTCHHDFHHDGSCMIWLLQSSVLDSEASAWLSHKPLFSSSGFIRYLSFIYLGSLRQNLREATKSSLPSHPHPSHDQGLLALPLTRYQIWPFLSITTNGAIIQAASSLTWTTDIGLSLMSWSRSGQHLFCPSGTF